MCGYLTRQRMRLPQIRFRNVGDGGNRLQITRNGGLKMRKLTGILLATFVLMSLPACGSNTNQPTQGIIERPQQNESTKTQETPPASRDDEQPENNAAANPEASTGSNIVIAYFTVPETDGVDTVANASRVATENGVVGNTEFIAMEIQKNLGGDLFAIETVQEYPGSHDALLEFAYNEKSDDARPELSTHIESLDGYEYIFIGFPNWNADLPMPLYTFFEEYDFSGKTIIPFCPHGGSGFSRTESTIARLQPGAVVSENGLTVSRNDVADSAAEIRAWAEGLSL